MARDVLCNATGAPDLALFVTDGEEGVADPTQRPVGSDNAELLHGDHTERSPVESLNDADAVISSYESARVVVTGGRKPRVKTERGPDSAAIEATFGGRAMAVKAGFTRDIFSRNRKNGQLP